MSYLLPWLHEPQSGCLLSGLVPLSVAEWLHPCFSPVVEAHLLFPEVSFGMMGWMMASPTKNVMSQNVNLFVKRVCGDLFMWISFRGDHSRYRVSPKSNDVILRRDIQERHGRKEEKVSQGGSRPWNHKPRIVQSYQKLEEASKDFPPQAFGGSMALKIPWFQASSLQDCERIQLCCFHPSLKHFAMVAQGN